MFELLPDGRRIYTDGNHTVQQDALLLAGFVRLRPGLRAADIGCGCVLNPGTVVGRNTSIYPLTPIRGVIPPDCIVKSPDCIVIRE